MAARDGADLFTEHAKLLAEYEKIISKAQRAAAGQGQLSPLEHWREAVKEAEGIIAGVSGARSEDEARQVAADELERGEADPVLYRAVVEPDANEPQVTMQDAKEMYRVERMNGASGRNQINRLERVCKRIEGSLGPLNKIALVDLKREHARNLRDDMLATKKRDGSPLSPSSVRRELDMVRAMVSIAITEHDPKGRLTTPLMGLRWLKPTQHPILNGISVGKCWCRRRGGIRTYEQQQIELAGEPDCVIDEDDEFESTSELVTFERIKTVSVTKVSALT